jgi:hypothetical protein
MNAEIKDRWIARLRDPNIKQGKHRLCIEREGVVRYCCLGVLTELAVEEGVIPPGEFRVEYATSDPDDLGLVPVKGYGLDSYGYPEVAVLPKGVVEWAGLPDESPMVGTHVLASLNDHGVPFAEIADLIEENF